MGESRIEARGKFLYAGSEKLYVKGVTYGTFRPNAAGDQFPEPEQVCRDFEQMAAHGLNAIRTYTVPPRWLLDAAQRFGLRVMVGIPWEQDVAFLEDRSRVRAIEASVRGAVRACAAHPAVLCFAIGNEIPSSIVRWHGAGAVQRHLERLVRAVKDEDPRSLVTYANYPTTEYLDLPFLDLLCFNIYLEDQARYEAYLARLHTIAGNRPLLVTELGLDSCRNGEDCQAQSLDWQVRSTFAAGCAGAFVFAWTDEWQRGGEDVTGWDFGLTRRDRSAKPALSRVSRAYAELPVAACGDWPRISVVLCSYNGARTIRDCLEGLRRLEYPNAEVIVVDDGSTDGTAAIVDEYGFRRISTENRGLSNARNTGIWAATGEIVAFIDDDARPDPHWLTYLAATYRTTNHAGVGGPNIPPGGDGPIADCVANAPGWPIHVLLSDSEAEHIPGVNSSFRTDALKAIGGFDPQFRTAGDDVDLCWRILERGWTLGFAPGAVVWHHPRNSVCTYWKQQQGYGRAEALLERKWPEKYNELGQASWSGRIYSRGPLLALPWTRNRIYHGTAGLAPFQSVYGPPVESWSALVLMPEWYLIIAVLGVLAAFAPFWAGLTPALPLLLAAVAVPAAQAVRNARRAAFPAPAASRTEAARRFALTALLHLLQPLARLKGRIQHGLVPWRRRGRDKAGLPLPWRVQFWRERWLSPADLHHKTLGAVRERGGVAFPGGGWDGWDIEIRGGALGGVRTLLAVEAHAGGRQVIRFRAWPRVPRTVLFLLALFGALTAGAVSAQAWVAAAALFALTSAASWRLLLDLRYAMGCFQAALNDLAADLDLTVMPSS